jgi:hypothetical protein
LDIVLDARPDLFNHNLETVERLQRPIRKTASYDQSLNVLAHAKKRGFPIKSGIMLGLGEKEEEIRKALSDLATIGLDVLTLGQYLQPSSEYTPIDRWATPEEFARWKDLPRKKEPPHRSLVYPGYLSFFPIFQTAFSVLMTRPSGTAIGVAKTLSPKSFSASNLKGIPALKTKVLPDSSVR